MEFLPDAKFLPAFHLIRNLGADFQTAAQTECAVIVHCRLTELLAADDFCAWIRVQVLDVIRLPELTKRFPSRAVSQTLETYSSYESCDEIMMQDGSWTEKTWTLQGDMIEKKLMFTDDSGVRHLVRMYVFDCFHQVTYFGNITETT